MSEQFKLAIKEKQEINYAVKSHGQASIKDVDLKTRIVTGFYNSCFYFDSDKDVSLPGCLTKSINERGPKSAAVQKIKHLKDHDWTQIPGKIQVLEEKTIDGITGCYFETKMVDTTLGNDVLINYQEKVYDNHSFGFQYIDGEKLDASHPDWDKMIAQLINPQDAKDCGYMYVWKEYRMYEGSTVAFGANALTPYLGVKSMDKLSLSLKVNNRISILEKQIKSGTQSDEMIQSFCMELLQLKQMINELFSSSPLTNATSTQAGRQAESTKKGMFQTLGNQL